MLYFKNKMVCANTAPFYEDTLETPRSDKNYMYFQAEEDGAYVRMRMPSSFNARFEYSTDGVSWSEWIADKQGIYDDFPRITLAKRGDFVFLRAVSENRFTSNGSDTDHAYFYPSPKKIRCGGSIMSLLDNNSASKKIKDAYCFYKLFQDCTSLTSTPELPATTLASDCYQYMFLNCISLTTAPELPAETLVSWCYYGMFYGCTSLTVGADIQNAKTLASRCCYQMYYNCTNLSSAWTPNISSWNTSYFSSWLYGVAQTGTLYKPSGLDLTSFIGTSGIPSGWVSAVPTKTVTFSAVGSGTNPFSYTPEGDSAVQVQAGQSSTATLTMPQPVAINTSGPMCLMLANGNAIGFGSTVTLNYDDLTNGCTVTCVNVDASTCLKFTAAASNSTVGMTHSGTNATSTKPVLYTSTDNGATWQPWDGSVAVTLANVGDAVLVGGINKNGISSSVSNYSHFTMTGLVAADGDISSILDFHTNAPVQQFCFYKLFQSCTSLTSAPELPATALASNCYSNMFQSCTSLTSAPELPATTLENDCYSNMFQNCTSLTSAPELPAETLASYCYGYMFYGCTSLTSAPELPAETLAGSCYYGMFQGCTSLTSAPELPATTLTSNCYTYMFYGCRLLDSVKVRASSWDTSAASDWLYGVAASGTLYKSHAASIPTNSTSGVPSGWTALDYDGPLTFTANAAGSTIGMAHYGTNQTSTQPVIYTSTDDGQTWSPWDYTTITLANVGDRVMMYGDNPNGISKSTSDYSSFTMTGSVSASGDCTTLVAQGGSSSINAGYCFYRLFYNCTALATAPELPATRLADLCYQNMFRGCASLATAPELPATTLASSCYSSMFYDCTSLTSAPGLPATTLASDCYSHMFRGCASLTSAPELPATTLEVGCYYAMFYGCTSLTSAPELPATTLASYCYYAMFRGCTSLTSESAPELPATTLASNCYSHMFNGCVSLTSAPELPATTLTSNCYSDMFYGCTNLTTAPELPATTLAMGCYYDMFRGCRSLTTAPELPATMLAVNCYSAMFFACTSLTMAPELPATTLASSCYSYMFYGCTALTTAPELPATTLASSCYSYMFQGCRQLNHIKVGATGEWNTNNASSWVDGVSTSGTFYKPSSLTITNGTSGVPNGWEIVSF